MLGIEAFVEPFSIGPVDVLGRQLVEVDAAELAADALDLRSVTSAVVGERVEVMWSSHVSRYSERVVDRTSGTWPLSTSVEKLPMRCPLASWCP